MKLCVYGAGSIGGYLGVQLALAGFEVSMIARGPHLDAMRENGLTLLIEGQERVAKVPCTDNPEEIGFQDFVLLTMKAHSVGAILDKVTPLLGPETAVVTVQNGILWWYFYKLPGPWENRHLESTDPGGRIWKSIGPDRAIGCVVYPSCEIVEPGVIKHIDGRRFMVGEPDGSGSDRVKALSHAFTCAGFRAPVRKRIRDDIWLKLWGNVSYNPVSILTHATLKQISKDDGGRRIIRQIMEESKAVAEKLDVNFSVDIETRISWAEDVGEHKTSMLQDLEKGRSMEIEALVGSVSEMGKLVGVDTPTIDVVLQLARLRAKAAGLV